MTPQNLKSLKMFFAKKIIVSIVRAARKKDLIKGSRKDDLILSEIEKLLTDEKINDGSF